MSGGGPAAALRAAVLRAAFGAQVPTGMTTTAAPAFTVPE